MCDHHNDGRREALKRLAVLGLAGLGGSAALAAVPAGRGAPIPGGEACPGDGTPLQFMPRTAPDAEPLKDELAKYPKCPYCGMDRTEWQHSRHLVQYDDHLVDGTCSLHCLAISLALNMDRGPKAMYAADYGSGDKIKPLLAVEGATYLIGSKLKGTMSATSKLAFAGEAAAKAVQAEQGGTLGNFDEALRQTYLNLAEDTRMIRKNRAERRAKMPPKG